MLNEFLIGSYRRKLSDVLSEIKFTNLAYYTLDSNFGNDLTDFYKYILEDTIEEKVTVTGNEIRDGKYEITFTLPNCKEYTIISKPRYTRDDVNDILMELIIHYLQDLFEYKKLKILSIKNVTGFC